MKCSGSSLLYQMSCVCNYHLLYSSIKKENLTAQNDTNLLFYRFLDKSINIPYLSRFFKYL